MFKAIFFDLDETLIDASKAHNQANILAFAELGVDFDWVRNATKDMDLIGLRIGDMMKVYVEAIGMSKEIDVAKLIQRRGEIFINLLKAEAFLLPGAREAIINAKTAGEIVALVSSAVKDYLDVFMDQFNLRKYIDFIICAEDILQGKPAPDCYLRAYERLLKIDADILKSEVLAVEDSNNGINAAQGAGLKTLMVPYKFTGEIKVKPDYMIESLVEFDLKKFL